MLDLFECATQPLQPVYTLSFRTVRRNLFFVIICIYLHWNRSFRSATESIVKCNEFFRISPVEHMHWNEWNGIFTRANINRITLTRKRAVQMLLFKPYFQQENKTNNPVFSDMNIASTKTNAKKKSQFAHIKTKR